MLLALSGYLGNCVWLYPCWKSEETVAKKQEENWNQALVSLCPRHSRQRRVLISFRNLSQQGLLQKYRKAQPCRGQSGREGGLGDVGGWTWGPLKGQLLRVSGWVQQVERSPGCFCSASDAPQRDANRPKMGTFVQNYCLCGGAVAQVGWMGVGSKVLGTPDSSCSCFSWWG